MRCVLSECARGAAASARSSPGHWGAGGSGPAAIRLRCDTVHHCIRRAATERLPSRRPTPAVRSVFRRCGSRRNAVDRRL